MRSSIACIRCRRSKVKCVNAGVGTACRSCENAGRECTYPPPVTTGVRRRESLSGSAEGGEPRPQRPPKKRGHTSTTNYTSASRESPRPLVDALSPSLLTPAVWQELFEIFQVHYSADLPFLHPPTFLKPLRQASMVQATTLPTPTETEGSARPPMSQEFLLAFLALTARFHPKLVAHHSPPTSTRPSNPLIASEYYAAAATERLSGVWSHDNQIQDIERTQALLMLGLHEWGMCRGSRAWLTVGVAIRSAQVMGLQYELDLDDEPLSLCLPLSDDVVRVGVNGQKNSSSGNKNDGEVFVQQEVRRRTFWSCYILDRYLSSGKYRPQMLRAKELRVQLPASERSFLFAQKVRTLMLGENDDGGASRAEVQSRRQAAVMLETRSSLESGMPPSPRTIASQESEEDKGRLEVDEEEGLVSRYIKILEIYGRVLKWSSAGGRRIEQHPPWDERGEFTRLLRQCLDFKATLPRQHELTAQNTQAHISLKTSTTYTLIHVVYLLCQIMLHREYLPFIPVQCSKPEGPIDRPMFPQPIPHDFWEVNAGKCFKAARDIMDLVASCQEWSALVETPVVGFAIYTAASMGVYSMYFPWMDPDGFMCTPAYSRLPNGPKQGGSKGFESTRKAIDMIGQMQLKLKMADGWFKMINRMYKYFKRLKSDYIRNDATQDSDRELSPQVRWHRSLRDGGFGGDPDEFRLLERNFQDFGNAEDQDVEMTDANQRRQSRPFDAIYDDSHSGTTVKSEDVDKIAATSELSRRESQPWNAINTVPGASSSRPGSVSTAGFRPLDSYQQTRPQQHDINNFRPAYSQDTPNGLHASQNLTTPSSANMSTPSHSSPPFERHQQSYSTWTPHNQTSYPSASPQAPYTNGVSHPQQPPTPLHSAGAYSTPNQHSQRPSHTPQTQQPWTAAEKKAWLDNLPTRFGGDDLAAFAAGEDIVDWALTAANRGLESSWLSALFQATGGMQ